MTASDLKFPMVTIHRLRTDYEQRLHIERDVDSAVLDCFVVTLPPYANAPGLLVHRAGEDMNDLFREAVATVAYLKAQPWKLVAPPDHFQPFGIITARNFEEFQRECAIRREVMIASTCRPADIERRAGVSVKEGELTHEQGVASLCRALDLLDGAPLPAGIPFPAELSLKRIN